MGGREDLEVLGAPSVAPARNDAQGVLAEEPAADVQRHQITL